MLTSAQWSVFMAATIVLLIVPGPSVIYVLTQAVEHGRRGALFASLGLALGDFVQAVFTAAGLSAVLASSLVAFHVVRYAGAAYLVFLGLKRFRKAVSSEPHYRAGPRRARALPLVTQAFLALNPKTTLFFFALFPQVIDVHTSNAWSHMLLLGGVFASLGFWTNFLFGVVGGRVALRFAPHGQFGSSARYVTGTVLIGLGLVAAAGK
jgi:threonine/homoserine/homoserine lactone efflux protein